MMKIMDEFSSHKNLSIQQAMVYYIEFHAYYIFFVRPAIHSH